MQPTGYGLIFPSQARPLNTSTTRNVILSGGAKRRSRRTSGFFHNPNLPLTDYGVFCSTTAANPCVPADTAILVTSAVPAICCAATTTSPFASDIATDCAVS